MSLPDEHRGGSVPGPSPEATTDGGDGRATASNGIGFATFAAFYMVAFLLDAAEEWSPAAPALAFLVAVVALYARGITRWTFLAFLVASSGYILAVHFPDPGNHNNLYLLCNLFLIGGILWGSRPAGGLGEAALFEALKPPLRVALSLVYLFAGFHKLNSDFFQPEYGCAQEFFSAVWGIGPFPPVTLTATGAAIVGGGVAAWEFGGALLLWFRATQPIMIAVSALNHAALAMVQFFDFSSLAFALLLTFVPAAYWRMLEEAWRIRVGPLRISRLGIYVILNLSVALALGASYLVGDGHTPNAWQGLALNAGLLIFLWPILRRLVRGPRPRWEGVPMWRATVPRWAVVLPVIVVLIGLNPYLGLRTGGAFTMFSNLQIEGGRSNHLLLGSNPLSIFDLQEDAVHVLAIDPRHTDDPENDLTRTRLPVLEFQKRIIRWRSEGLTGLTAIYEYGGVTYRTADLARDNPWDIDGYSAAHYLVNFVPVRDEPPILCTW